MPISQMGKWRLRNAKNPSQIQLVLVLPDCKHLGFPQRRRKASAGMGSLGGLSLPGTCALCPPGLGFVPH